MTYTVSEEELDALNGNPIFGKLGRSACAELLNRFPPRSYGDGDEIASRGGEVEHIFVILEGVVRVYQRFADGREVTNLLAAAPMVLADGELLAGTPLISSLEALGDCRAMAIPAADYRALIDRNPAVAMAQMQHLSRMIVAGMKLHQHASNKLINRMAHLLLVFGELFGDERSDGLLITRPLIHAEAARILCAYPRSVAQAVIDLTKAGAIMRRSDNRYTLLDLDQLEHLAGSLAGSLRYRMSDPPPAPARERLPTAEIELPTRQAIRIESEARIGSHQGCHVTLGDASISGLHCRIFRGPTGTRYWVQDLASDTGTYLNGRPITRALLRDGDTLRVGSTDIEVRLVWAAPVSPASSGN